MRYVDYNKKFKVHWSENGTPYVNAYFNIFILLRDCKTDEGRKFFPLTKKITEYVSDTK